MHRNLNRNPNEDEREKIQKKSEGASQEDKLDPGSRRVGEGAGALLRGGYLRERIREPSPGKACGREGSVFPSGGSKAEHQEKEIERFRISGEWFT